MAESIVSVSRGADLVRKDRQTLYNHRKQGKLSFVRRDDGSFGVDVAELRRVYKKLYVTPAEIEENNRSAVESASSARVKEIQHQLEIRELELRHEKESADRLRNDVKTWQEQAAEAAASVKLLEHQTAELTEQADKAEAHWKQALAERKNEIDQARAEAAEIRQREQEQRAALQAEQSRVAALESRGLIARLFNKKIEPGEAV